MKKLAGILFLAVVLSTAGCRFERPTPEAGQGEAAGPEGTPEQLVATWVEMWNAYDLDQVETHFLGDDRVSYFSSEFEGAIWGFERVVEHHEGFGFIPGGEEKGTRLWVEDLSGGHFGDSAVLTGIWYFERDGEGGEPSTAPPQRGPVTFVCVLTEGGWRFAHMNFGNYLDAEGG